MKKIIYSISVIALTLLSLLFTTACDSNDEESEVVAQQLVLSVSADEVDTDAQVQFQVQLAALDVTSECTLTANGETISNPHTFTTVGSYEVVASREGATDSQPLTITVEESAPDVDFDELVFDEFNGEGVVVYNGESFPVTKTATYYLDSTIDSSTGAYLTDVWLQVVFDGNTFASSQNLVAVRFEIPCVTQTDYTKPGDADAVYQYVMYSRLNGVEIPTYTVDGDTRDYSTEVVDGYTGDLNYMMFDSGVQYVGSSTFDMQISGENTYQITYEGDLYYSPFAFSEEEVFATSSPSSQARTISSRK